MINFKPVDAHLLYRHCDVSLLEFETSDQLPPLDGIFGQARAVACPRRRNAAGRELRGVDRRLDCRGVVMLAVSDGSERGASAMIAPVVGFSTSK